MAVVLQEAKCEATPLLERVLCSLHVVRPCDAVATEGVLFDATMKEMRFDYDKRERVNQWHAVGGVVRGIEVKRTCENDKYHSKMVVFVLKFNYDRFWDNHL